MPFPSLRASKTASLLAGPLLAAVLLTGALSACGGSDSTDVADAATPTQPATTVAAPTTLAPVVTDAPVETDPPIVVDDTAELAAFAEANGDLTEEWSTQLEAFGGEAIDHLDDVSAAPSADAAADLSDQMIEAIGPDTTDSGLVVLRDFATTISSGIGAARDGDQDGALDSLLALQTQADQLSAVLARIEA